jgi:pimeloyl-ACP methyl ester carboxylesterase
LTSSGPRIASELAAWGELRRLRRSPVFTANGNGGAPGAPVLLIPGFMSTAAGMSVMAGWLRRRGHGVTQAPIGMNWDCAEASIDRLQGVLEKMSEEAGGPVAIVGHSRGGHMARVLAVRNPQRVAAIVTLGMPPLDRRAIHPVVQVPAAVVGLLGSARVPGLFGVGCFRGECCRGFRDDLHGPFPGGVPFTAVYSREDGIVDWRMAGDPAAERRDVRSSHVGMPVNAEVYEVIAGSLATVVG